MSDSEHKQESKSDGATLAADEVELARMGYKQELNRELGLMQNFGVSFSIISVITGIPSLFLYGLVRPAVMVWGWIVVCRLKVSISQEKSVHILCSAHPTSGGPYFWAAMLSEPQNAALASWITGWFNLLGQVAVTTGISFACANFLSTAATLKTNFVPTANTTIGIYAAVLVAQVGWSTFKSLKPRRTFSLVVAILAKAPSHQSGTFVFKTFIDGTGPEGAGWGDRASHAYVALIGVSNPIHVLVPDPSFDARRHMTEETKNAAMAGSVGIVMAIGVSAVLGWFLILGLLFSIQDLEATTGAGQPVTQIFLDTVGENGAIVLMVIVIGAMFFCGTFSITSNSRMMFAFARDGGIPGHTFFNYVNARWKSPIRTVWLACFLSFCLGLPSLGSTVAFSAATSIATIGLYISYAIPIALRVIYRDKFVRGPFHLGAFSYPIAVAAVVWIAFIAIIFILPQVNVAVGIVIVYSVGFWLISARKWFTGPVKQIAAEEMGINVMEPAEALKFEQEKAKQAQA
ncbi:APC amino acid permease [Mycena filopes]|nr:APC amino acid permease [Mycena filopes]